MDNVVEFPGQTFADLEPEKILAGAIEADLENVVVIGRDRAGNHYMASSSGRCPDILWLLKIAEARVLAEGLEEDGQ